MAQGINTLKKYTTPKDIIIAWDEKTNRITKKKSKRYFNVRLGKKIEKKLSKATTNNPYIVVESEKMWVSFLYFKYLSEEDLLLVEIISTFSSAYKINPLFGFFQSVYLVDCQKNIIDINAPEDYKKVSIDAFCSEIEQVLKHDGIIINSPAELFAELFVMFGAGRYSGVNAIANWRDVSSFISFMRYKPPVNNHNLLQQKVDRLLSYSILYSEPIPPTEKDTQKAFSEIAEISDPALVKYFPDIHKDTFAVVEKVNTSDPLCVIRIYTYDVFNKIVETGRMYVGSKNTHVALAVDGCFVSYQEWDTNSDGWDFYINDLDDDIIKGTKLEYIKPVLKQLKKATWSIAIWLMLAEPLMEQICKVSTEAIQRMEQLFIVLRCKSEITPYECLKMFFGDIKYSEKKLFKKLGINRYQFQREMTPEMMDSVGIITKIKNVLEMDDISDIDNNSFNAIFDFIQNNMGGKDIPHPLKNHEPIDKAPTHIMNIAQLINHIYGLRTFIRMLDDLSWLDSKYEFIKNENDTSIEFWTQYYWDYLRTISQINTQTKFTPYVFDSFRHLREAHDIAFEILNRQEHPKSEKWDKVAMKWSRFEYSDDNYAIIAPSAPIDLAYEGLHLHHCVKTYISDVENGLTNILFLRKKSNIKEPLFTIEISNRGTIEQIHGLCNKNINSDPDAFKFVSKWIVAKKLKTNNINKIR